MKKILIGLTALSVVSFSALIDKGGSSADMSSIFEGTQKGKITLKGSIVALPQTPTYIVFSDTDDTGANASDELVFPQIELVTYGEVGRFKDGATPNKVYVRRLVNGEIKPLEQGDINKLKVAFTFKDGAEEGAWKGNGETFGTQSIFNQIPMSVMNQVLTEMGEGYELDPYGRIKETSSGKWVVPNTAFQYNVNNGNITFSLKAADAYDAAVSEEAKAKLMTVFLTEREISSPFLVKIQ